jgi:outer membrane protein OmpA-like peptidoglycan-associated protein
MPRWGWLLLAGGCPRKPPPAPEEPLPQTIESKLQLVSVAPQTISPDEATSVIVYGAGFQKGLKGWVGEVSAVRINWRSENQVELSIPALSPGTYDVVVQNPGGSDDRLREGLTVRGSRGAGCAYVVLYFETDRAALTEAAAKTLLSLVPCYQSSDDKIRVAGFADERGTTDYNLALAYERAMTVKSFLREAGLEPGRMPVQSYGEERPAVPGTSEEAWALNRRVEITLEME